MRGTKPRTKVPDRVTIRIGDISAKVDEAGLALTLVHGRSLGQPAVLRTLLLAGANAVLGASSEDRGMVALRMLIDAGLAEEPVIPEALRGLTPAQAQNFAKRFNAVTPEQALAPLRAKVLASVSAALAKRNRSDVKDEEEGAGAMLDAVVRDAAKSAKDGDKVDAAWRAFRNGWSLPQNLSADAETDVAAFYAAAYFEASRRPLSKVNREPPFPPPKHMAPAKWPGLHPRDRGDTKKRKAKTTAKGGR